jgi:hypothetical protein
MPGRPLPCPGVFRVSTQKQQLNYKGLNFQLKHALDESRYNDLWPRLNRSTLLAAAALLASA